MDIILAHSDNIKTLKKLPENSIDSIITDPPYGLAFMGSKWDYDVPSVEFWAAALRVLKPGGHVVSFSSARTYHRMVVNIEDAGFEIRDQLAWVYGSGFPKNHNISKAIDKAGGLSPKDQSSLLREKRIAANLSRDEVAAIVGCTSSSVRDWEEGRARATGRALEWITPSAEYRDKLADLLGYSSDEREAIGVGIDRRNDGTVYGLGLSGVERSGGHTSASLEWAGWGTALKPSMEPICLARKPLLGTVVANVLEHRTGGINIDGCRIGSVSGEGRHPATFLHDGSDEVLSCFPSKAGGQDKRGHGSGSRPGGFGDVGADKGDGKPCGPLYSDSGSPARFFYCAKASKDDRAGSKHPTVKPVELMRWLCRLVTPPGGTLLDPFAGSGTTGAAARLEGFNAILIELEPEYVADIERRLGIKAQPVLSP